MGFLDHSTNNIIVDAVLTDTGREFLAANKGDFKIAFFSLSDDEVDYTIIEKFGRTVGKQKIELNTPVFEAQTNENQALKHMLVSYSEPLLFRLPSLTIVSTANPTVSAGNSVDVRFEQSVSGDTTIAPEAQDSTFLVTMDNKFLFLSNGGGGDAATSEMSDSTRHTSTEGFRTYEFPISQRNSQNGAIVPLKIQAKALSQNTFNFYGDTANKSQITTTLTVQGLQSGVRNDVTVVVTQN